MLRRRACTLLLLFICWQGSVLGQAGPPVPGGPPSPGGASAPRVPGVPVMGPDSPGGVDPAEAFTGDKLNFSNADVGMVLEDYAQRTGRTLLLDPNLPKATINLKSVDELTIDEYLKAVESVLNMHGIGLIRVDDKFLKVVSNKEIIKDELPIREQQFADVPDDTGGVHRIEVPLPETGEVVSLMIQLKYIDVAEATSAIEPLRHTYSSLTPYERINSILITDTAANINRISRVLRLIDQPAEMREEPHVMQIAFAVASEVKAKLEEIIAESQKESQAKPSTVPRSKDSGAPGVVRTLPGVIRARTSAAAQSKTKVPDRASTSAVVEAAERGIISGTVQIVADDRTNLLIIITRPENMKFFETIVKVLDVETAPEVEVKVFRLEYAKAEDIEGMLNELVGAKSSSKDEGRAATGEKKDGGSGERKSTTLREYASRETPRTTKSGEPAQSKIGQLSSENIKILSDERTNALIIMASRSDLKTMEKIIGDMDMMLSQVLIEAVILEIQLGENVQSGVDWVQRSMITSREQSNDGQRPVFSFAGGGGGGSETPVDATTLGRASVGSGLTYYLTMFDVNVDAVIAMTAGDTRTRILSSPVIVTHDNTEAKIESTEQRYFYKGQRYVGGSTEFGGGRYQDDVDREEVGIKLTVTPHINDKKLVVMEISQEVEQLAGGQTIGENVWPTTLRRTFEASIAVQNRETIVLGGLVKTQFDNSSSGIPLLWKIPLLGALFSQRKKDESQSEIVVFITPYVLDSPEEMMTESRRRKHSLNAEGLWEKGWSQSRLAEPEEIDPELIGDESTALEVPPTVE
jgi:general secretion pathway protein D